MWICVRPANGSSALALAPSLLMGWAVHCWCRCVSPRRAPPTVAPHASRQAVSGLSSHDGHGRRQSLNVNHAEGGCGEAQDPLALDHLKIDPTECGINTDISLVSHLEHLGSRKTITAVELTALEHRHDQERLRFGDPCARRRLTEATSGGALHDRWRPEHACRVARIDQNARVHVRERRNGRCGILISCLRCGRRVRARWGPSRTFPGVTARSDDHGQHPRTTTTNACIDLRFDNRRRRY